MAGAAAFPSAGEEKRGVKAAVVWGLTPQTTSSLLCGRSLCEHAQCGHTLIRADRLMMEPKAEQRAVQSFKGKTLATQTSDAL